MRLVNTFAPTRSFGPGKPGHPTQTPARRQFEASPASLLRESGDYDRYLPCPSRLTPDNVDRPLDAGWLIACSQVHSKRPATAIEASPWIEQAHRFLQRLLDCRDADDQRKLAEEMPDLSTAYSIYRTTDKLTRGRLEGHLLTGCPFADVATACGISAASAEAYERLFFRVHADLKMRVPICLNAFDNKFWLGMTDDDADLVLKKAGLVCGAGVVEWVARFYRDGLHIPAIEQLNRDVLKDLREMVQTRILILLWLLPVLKFGRITMLMELVADLSKLIAAWPIGHDSPRPWLFGSSISAESLEAWWSAWTNVVQQLTQKMPRNMDDLPEVA